MSAGRDNVMSGRTAFWLLAVGASALAGSILLGIYGDLGGTPRSAGSSAYSTSAVGHGAFAALLRETGVTVEISRTAITRRGGGDLIVLAEPDLELLEPETIDAMVAAGNRLLIVLPKWSTVPSRRHPGWIAAAELLPVDAVDELAETVSPGIAIARPAGALDWRTGVSGIPTLDRPQLAVARNLKPVIATDKGVLAGLLRSEGLEVALLTDPDLISNAGLHRGENAAIALALVEQLRPPGGAVVFDETLHGFGRAESIWRFFLEPPWLAATLLALLATLLTAWVAATRLGAPLDPAPAYRSGKTSLVTNAAGLLVHAGHRRHVADGYVAAMVADVAERLRIGGGEHELRKRLDEAARRRGLRHTLADLRPHEGPVALARQCHAWKKEMLGGS